MPRRERQQTVLDLLGNLHGLDPLSAIDRELNLLRRNGVIGPELLKTLTRLYHQHGMRDWVDRRSSQLEDQQIPKIVCSKALI